ncbi:MAG: bifunctional 3,4-dihydroxy-2-butanone-4-phosphate synthase/GTP cyclohydrolase II [Burkholderiaceae bacterium]
MSLSPIQEIIQEMRAGRMVILVDDEDRDNVGELVLAADRVSADAVTFMALHARGLICLALTEARCRLLQLPLMVPDVGARSSSRFTVSIEATEGVSTGISAADRARTVAAAVAPGARAQDIVQPGHIFPVMAQPGGVLVRAGRTEASCDLAQMSGHSAAAVVCEMLAEDGSMARMPQLIAFAQAHGLKIGSVADLIHLRSAQESMIERMAERETDTPWGRFRMTGYRDVTGANVHLALVHGRIEPDRDTLVRVHEPISVLDLIDAGQGTHSWPVARALTRLRESPAGVMVMLNASQSNDTVLAQLQRWSEPAAAAEPAGHSAVQSARKIDLRTYGIGAQILRDLGVRRMRLLAAPVKMPSMTGFDLEVTGFEN